MDSQANFNITNQFDKIPQDIINEKQESYQRKEFLTNQFILDRPITDRPMSTNDASDEKLTISNPIEHKQSNEKKEKKEVQRLSTTDSMQEFLEIPDNIPSGKYVENEEEEEET